jgi:hypothetical protein
LTGGPFPKKSGIERFFYRISIKLEDISQVYPLIGGHFPRISMNRDDISREYPWIF